MAVPPNPQSTPTNQDAPAEAAGSYKVPATKSSNPLPWILGLLALLVLALAIAWGIGMFDDEDDDLEELEPGETLNNNDATYVVPAEVYASMNLVYLPD